MNWPIGTGGQTLSRRRYEDDEPNANQRRIDEARECLFSCWMKTRDERVLATYHRLGRNYVKIGEGT